MSFICCCDNVSTGFFAFTTNTKPSYTIGFSTRSSPASTACWRCCSDIGVLNITSHFPCNKLSNEPYVVEWTTPASAFSCDISNSFAIIPASNGIVEVEPSILGKLPFRMFASSFVLFISASVGV